MNIYKHEFKVNFKTMVGWIVTLCGLVAMLMAFYPMFKNDLRAIFRLYYHDKSDSEIDTILKPILKSKTTS